MDCGCNYYSLVAEEIARSCSMPLSYVTFDIWLGAVNKDVFGFAFLPELLWVLRPLRLQTYKCAYVPVYH